MTRSSCFFISVEGVEGVGKTTAISTIEEFFISKSLEYVLTREPGGTALSEKIRACLLQNDNNGELMMPETELLLMFATRSQNISHVIKPALKKGVSVISDRFTDASYAYQGGGRQLDMALIETLDCGITHDLVPDLTFLLDAPIDIAMSRLAGRDHDRIEQESLDFFERVRVTYLDRAKKFQNRFVIIDASQPINVVRNDMCSALCERLLVGSNG